MIVQRGFTPPPPSTSDRLLQRAAPGHFFEVITHGHGAMYSYAVAGPARRTAGRSPPTSGRLQLSQHAAAPSCPPRTTSQLKGSLAMSYASDQADAVGAALQARLDRLQRASP